MERLILDYTVTGQHQLTLNNADAFSAFTKDNIRVIIDCASQEPIVTPLDRTALSSVAFNSSTHKLAINLTTTSAPLTVNGEVTVKVDDGNTFPTDYAKETTAAGAKTAAISAVQAIGDASDTEEDNTLFGKLANITAKVSLTAADADNDWNNIQPL